MNIFVVHPLEKETDKREKNNCIKNQVVHAAKIFDETVNCSE